MCSMLLLVGLVVLLVGIACGANGSNFGWFDEFSVLDSGYICAYKLVGTKGISRFCSIRFTRKPLFLVMKHIILSKK